MKPLNKCELIRNDALLESISGGRTIPLADAIGLVAAEYALAGGTYNSTADINVAIQLETLAGSLSPSIANTPVPSGLENAVLAAVAKQLGITPFTV